MTVLPASRVGEVSFTENDAIKRQIKFDVDAHAILRALHLHFADLGHVHHKGGAPHSLKIVPKSGPKNEHSIFMKTEHLRKLCVLHRQRMHDINNAVQRPAK